MLVPHDVLARMNGRSRFLVLRKTRQCARQAARRFANRFADRFFANIGRSNLTF